MCRFDAAARHRPLARSREQAVNGCRTNGGRGARKSRPVPRSSILTSFRPAPAAQRTCSVVLMATIRDLGLHRVNDCRARLRRHNMAAMKRCRCEKGTLATVDGRGDDYATAPRLRDGLSKRKGQFAARRRRTCAGYQFARLPESILGRHPPDEIDATSALQRKIFAPASTRACRGMSNRVVIENSRLGPRVALGG